jgi:dUTP pyrophosphatase
MNKLTIGFCKLDSRATIPSKAHKDDLGFDLHTLESVTLEPGVVTKVRTGIAVQFPENVGGIIKDRSSVATKKEVFTVAGVIDPGYRAEIIVAFFNPNDTKIHFLPGDKIAQMVLQECIIVEPIEIFEFSGKTDRNLDGFGSTGR